MTDFMDFRVRAALFDHTVRGALSPPHTQGAGIRNTGTARDRDLRAVLGNPQDKRQLRQTYSGRSARVARGPKAKLPRPTY
jgi:hypothetical protein